MPGDKVKLIETNKVPLEFNDAAGNTGKGDTWVAYTSKQRAVRVWCAAGGKDGELTKAQGHALGYWCHGLSFGTHKRYGYSVFTEYAGFVLEDDYDRLKSMEEVQSGDVVAFKGAPYYDHTCLVYSAPYRPINHTNLWVATKNAGDPVKICLVNQVAQVYSGRTISYWRPKAGSPSNAIAQFGDMDDKSAVTGVTFVSNAPTLPGFTETKTKAN